MSLEGGDFQTTFSRLKAAWGKAVKESFQDYGNWESVWVEDGEVLEFSRRGKKNPQRLKMVDLQQLVKDLVHHLQLALEKLLPEGMELPDSQVHKFVANTHEEEEFFMDCQSSMEIMAPLYQEFKDGHSTVTTISTTWLKKEQEFLHHLLAVLLVSGGVSPRTHLAQTCRIRGVERNIFHILGSPVWISSLSKTNSVTRSSGGLWAFPPQVAWPLYYYLGVVRPFSIHLLQLMGGQPNFDILKSFLFVHTLTLEHTQRLWARGDTKQVVENSFASPLGLKLDCFDLRQILQAVANRHLGGPSGNVYLYMQQLTRFYSPTVYR